MIYLIKSAGYDKDGKYIDLLKIGFTGESNMTTRINSYKYHNPTCILLYTIPDCDEFDEAKLQYYFRKYLYSETFNSSEWFYYSQEIIDYFKTHTTKESLSDLPEILKLKNTKFIKEVKEIVDYVLIKQYYDGKQNIKTILSDKTILVNSIISNKTLSTIDDVWEYINNTYGIFNFPEYDNQVNSILDMINKESYYNGKMKSLCMFKEKGEDILKFVLQRVSVDIFFYYTILGPEKIKSLSYQKSNLENEYLRLVGNQENKSSLLDLLFDTFKVGNKYTLSMIKDSLKDIYAKSGIDCHPKASDLEKYFELKKVLITNKETGKRDSAYEILKIKE